MKKLLFIWLLFLPVWAYTQGVKPAPEDKAVVYFVRTSGVGALINFTYFDSTRVIGRFKAPKYLRYECEPGKHLFWARSENKDFVQADLEAGKIYIIHVIPLMGAFKASVALKPVNEEDYKMKKIQKLLSKKPSETFSQEELDVWQVEMKEVIRRGFEKLEKLDREILQLGERSFEPEELVYEKDK